MAAAPAAAAPAAAAPAAAAPAPTAVEDAHIAAARLLSFNLEDYESELAGLVPGIDALYRALLPHFAGQRVDEWCKVLSGAFSLFAAAPVILPLTRQLNVEALHNVFTTTALSASVQHMQLQVAMAHLTAVVPGAVHSMQCIPSSVASRERTVLALKMVCKCQGLPYAPNTVQDYSHLWLQCALKIPYLDMGFFNVSLRYSECSHDERASCFFGAFSDVDLSWPLCGAELRDGMLRVVLLHSALEFEAIPELVGKLTKPMFEFLVKNRIPAIGLPVSTIFFYLSPAGFSIIYPATLYKTLPGRDLLICAAAMHMLAKLQDTVVELAETLQSSASYDESLWTRPLVLQYNAPWTAMALARFYAALPEQMANWRMPPMRFSNAIKAAQNVQAVIWALKVLSSVPISCIDRFYHSAKGVKMRNVLPVEGVVELPLKYDVFVKDTIVCTME